MRNFIFGFLLYFLVSVAYSQDILSFESGTYLDIDRLYEINRDIRSGVIDARNTITVFPCFTFTEDNRIEGIKNGNPENGAHKGSYNVVEENGLHYLQIKWDDNTMDKYLIICVYIWTFRGNNYFKYFSLYNKDGHPFFNTGIEVWSGFIDGENFNNIFINDFTKQPYGGFFSYNQLPLVVPTGSISASSELKEGSIVYSTDNLDAGIDVCWAARNGIGERIILQRSGLGYRGGLYIATGFISMSRPYLFKYNARPKKILVSYEGEHPEIYELEDTYHWQKIGEIPSFRDIWIDILEIYPGTRFDDTCINFFGKWDSK